MGGAYSEVVHTEEVQNLIQKATREISLCRHRSRQMGNIQMELKKLRYELGSMAVYCEHMNEPSGSIQGKELIGHMNNCQLLKDFSPWSYSASHSTCCCSVLGVPILVWLSTKDESMERSQPGGTSSQPSSLSALLITST